MRVQLLTFPGCPNAPATRERLLEVLRSLGHHAPIDEVNLEARDAPAELSGYGSPTILIDGVEIEGGDAGTNGGCRLYRDARGRLTGVPSEAAMVAALMHAQRRAGSGGAVSVPGEK